MRLFREKVEPVLRAECYRCHSATAEKVKGGLLLDTLAGMLKGGDSGPALVPGHSGDSPLIQAIRHEDGLEMPPKKPKLADQTIDDYVRWVDTGAQDPRESDPTSAGRAPAKEFEARRHSTPLTLLHDHA
jgi:hypothetical protein